VDAKTDKNDRSSDGPVVHEYDGIQECDNQLPRWWLMTLYAAIVFSAGYWLHYQTFGSGTNPMAAYDKEQAALRAIEAEKIKAAGAVTNESLLLLSKDEGTVKQGEEIFKTTCVPCHGPTGGGTIGPNLTDEYWLHGGKPEQIYKTVRDGFLPKGMPAWGPQLGEIRVRAAAAYVLTLKGTKVPGGKPPQGQLEEE